MDLAREQRKVEWRELKTVLLLIPCVLGTAMATGLISMVLSVVVSVIVGIWGSGYGGYWSVPDGWVLGTTLIGLALIAIGVVVKRAELKDGPNGVAEELGGRLLSKGDSADVLHQRLGNVVSELAVVMGTVEPAIYVLEGEPEINAFALGKEIDDSIIVVTQGALENLKRSELQAVVAHEFFHILNGDSKFNMWLTSWIYGVLLIYILGKEL